MSQRQVNANNKKNEIDFKITTLTLKKREISFERQIKLYNTSSSIFRLLKSF